MSKAARTAQSSISIPSDGHYATKRGGLFAVLHCFLITALFSTSALSQNSIQASEIINEADSAAANSASLAVQVQEKLQRIAQLEETVGAYGYELIETLMSLGSELQESGDYGSASQQYSRALHISRVNDGLFHESQIPYLMSLIRSDAALMDWESVNKHYALLEQLYKKLFTLEDPRLDEGLRRVVAWHVRAFNANLTEKRLDHLEAANKLFKLRLKISKQTLNEGHPEVTRLNQNIEICEKQLFYNSKMYKEFMAAEASRSTEFARRWQDATAYIANIETDQLWD